MGWVRLWREAPLWRHAVLGAGLGTVLVAIAPSACSVPPSTATNTTATGAPPPGSGSYASPGAQTAVPATPAGTSASSSAPGTVPPGPAAGLTFIPSPSAPKPFVPPVIAPNGAIGPAVITAPQAATPTPGFGTIRPTSPRTLPDAIPPRTLP